MTRKYTKLKHHMTKLKHHMTRKIATEPMNREQIAPVTLKVFRL